MTDQPPVRVWLVAPNGDRSWIRPSSERVHKQPETTRDQCDD